MTTFKKKINLDCDCRVSICDHAAEQIGRLLQKTFDGRYDDGWEEAHERMRAFMIQSGMPGAEDLELPPPPPRQKIEPKFNRESNKELIN